MAGTRTILARRRFLAAAAGASAGLLAPVPAWAEIGAPDLIAAAERAGRAHLLGLTAEEGSLRFDLPLPARGHAAAVHPHRAEAVVFARRPGTFAMVIDCATGRLVHRLEAPLGRHFYGHGCFSADGSRLYTTENAYGTGEGRIGIWDAAAGYRRIGEMSSGGIGPHEVLRLPGTETLAIANGGIRTHPGSGREKLNLGTMAPGLAYLDALTGRLIARIAPPPELRLASLRHLAVAPDGLVAVAAQWQGDPSDGAPLLALHRLGEPSLSFVEAGAADWIAMAGYAGSVAFEPRGERVAVTSPRGGRLLAWDRAGRLSGSYARPDICGLAGFGSGWIATDGLGGITALDGGLHVTHRRRIRARFDNHLVAVR